MLYNQIIEKIRKRDFYPIYFLCGEENYFIDKIYEALDNFVLTEEEKGFNYDVFYAPEVKLGQVIAAARGYPMMAEKRLVIVKELQRVKKEDLEILTPYLEKPAPTTVLVLIYKDKKLPDGRSKFMKALKNNALFFESKSLYEKDVLLFVQQLVNDKKYQIEPDALQILVQYLGTNLQLIESELNKIFIYLSAKKENLINKELVFEFVNIDKDFNVFQLIDALGARDVVHAHHIIDQMSKNFKDQPPLMIIPQIYKFYLQLAILKQNNKNSDRDIAEFLKINPYFAGKYKIALQKYSLTKIKQNLLYLLNADLALKGIHSTRMGEVHIMKTLIINLLSQ